MNQQTAEYLDNLLFTASVVQDDTQARRYFDMAEGAANALLQAEALRQPLHVKLMAKIKSTRDERFAQVRA